MRPISIMALHLFCNQATAVRFCHGAPICASGGMVYTLVLEANAEGIESSSLSLRTKLVSGISLMVKQQISNLRSSVRF